mmetsp:Transcript_14736/g.29741  ORF Transcript_14736/g.29741 Transcript_14736/m.29741 type:complete len:133 (+) Transcript_14736:235-633(+)
MHAHTTEGERAEKRCADTEGRGDRRLKESSGPGGVIDLACRLSLEFVCSPQDCMWHRHVPWGKVKEERKKRGGRRRRLHLELCWVKTQTRSISVFLWLLYHLLLLCSPSLDAGPNKRADMQKKLKIRGKRAE